MKVVRCDWYCEEYPNQSFLRHAYEHFDDLSLEEKVEALRSVFDSYFSILVDDEREKIFVYGHGEMHEADDEKIRSWIADAVGE